MVPFFEFLVMRELLSRCKAQLNAVAQLDQIQKQFIGTLVDTEIAVGYFIRRTNVSGATWVAYLAVKMKYGGDLAYFAKLISHLPPSRGLYANPIKQALDRRWSLSVQGVVAYSILREVRPFLHNEKSIIEVDCILRQGPTVRGELLHPFVQCGGRRVRRGVWYWPQIDDENDPRQIIHSA
jgi:hypothetical protein